MAWLAFTMSAQSQNKERTEERTEKLRKKAHRAQVLQPWGVAHVLKRNAGCVLDAKGEDARCTQAPR